MHALTSIPTTTNGYRAQGWANERSPRASQQVPGRRNLLVGMFEGEGGRLLLISVPTDTTFTCLFCHHDNSVNIRVDRKEGVALLVCKVCDQRYQSKVNRTSSFTWIVRHPRSFCLWRQISPKPSTSILSGLMLPTRPKTRLRREGPQRRRAGRRHGQQHQRVTMIRRSVCST